MASYNPPIIFTRLPNFTVGGLLPPYFGSDPTQPQSLAPYATTIDVVAAQVPQSPKRAAILGGFLAFRQALNQAGFSDGFQWLNGSFMELIEVREGRDPRDLDVVTFFHRPAHLRTDVDWSAFVQANPNLFLPGPNKQQFCCDAYFVDLDIDPINLVSQTRYWYGLFSHRRITGEWKGIVEVPLALTPADAVVSALISQGGPP
jgi:uncharacterized protein DUF6932